VTLQNDAGVPLAAAFDQMTADDAERAALAAWWALSNAGRKWFADRRALLNVNRGRAVNGIWPLSHGDIRPAGPCEALPLIEAAHAAALPVRLACATRLTAALRGGVWVLLYQPVALSYPKQAASVNDWRFFQAVVAHTTLAVAIEPIRRLPLTAEPAWRLRSGHVGPCLFKPAGVTEAPAAVAPNKRPASANDVLAAELADDCWNRTYGSPHAAAQARWQDWESHTTYQPSKVDGLRKAITKELKSAGRWPLENHSPKNSS
jgi:hypothetical protein